MRVKLQILISTYGREGIERTAKMPLDIIEGVEYIVGWQTKDIEPLIPARLSRPDIRVIISRGHGLSRNRNICLDAATAPLVLISDDDLIHTPKQINRIIKLFDKHPEVDIITFRHDAPDEYKRNYPEHQFNLASPPKGYFLVSFEMAMRRNRRTSKLRYNEWLGAGMELCGGEEDVLMADARDAGIPGLFIPETLVTHDHATTCHRLTGNPGLLMAKGAVFYRVRPHTWFPALCLHALKSGRPFHFIKHTLRGVAYARRKRIFQKSSSFSQTKG